MTLQGTVIQATGSWYDVLSDGKTLKCRLRGKLRLKGARSTSPVVVGDVVGIEEDEGNDWVITSISPRRNYVIRRASNLSKESHILASNIDQAMILATIAEPETAREFIDRILVTCEAYRVPPVILLGKSDLLHSLPEAADDFISTYSSAGYRVIRLSSVSGEGFDEVCDMVRGRTTLIAGNSGVGKSTLVKMLCPDEDIRTGSISSACHKGRHTTTFSTMYRIEDGGFIIDSPGIKGFGLIDIEGVELWHFFPEMMKAAQGCRFYNCTHTHEPGCAVMEAVRNGEIAYSRYESYLKILDEDDKYRK